MDDSEPRKRLWSVQETAHALGLTAAETRQLINSRMIRSVNVGGHIKIMPEWVDEFVDKIVKIGMEQR